jgi:hypothetical protein
VSIPPASAEDGASHEIAQLPSATVPVPSTRKVRVIDMSADNAVNLRPHEVAQPSAQAASPKQHR